MPFQISIYQVISCKVPIQKMHVLVLGLLSLLYCFHVLIDIFANVRTFPHSSTILANNFSLDTGVPEPGFAPFLYLIAAL